MDHRAYFPKVSKLLSDRTGPGTWVFLSLCPLPLDWITAQVTQVLEAVAPSGETSSAGEESKAQHCLVGLLILMIQNFKRQHVGIVITF